MLQGDGTREGSGKCNCDSGYKGDECEECSDKYYQQERNSTHTVCKGKATNNVLDEWETEMEICQFKYKN